MKEKEANSKKVFEARKGGSKQKPTTPKPQEPPPPLKPQGPPPPSKPTDHPHQTDIQKERCIFINSNPQH